METKIVDHIKNIGIAGAGGIGSFFTQKLVDYGLNRKQYPIQSWKITIFDDDVVDSGNLLHQRFTSEDLGRFKVDVLREQATYVGNRSLLNVEKRFMTVEDFPKFDVIFSCVDSLDFRRALYNYGWKHPELFWLDGRCSSRNIGLYNSSVPRKQLEDSLVGSSERRSCLLQVDKQNKLSHVTPDIVAGMMMQCFLNYLRGDSVNERILLLI